MKPKQPAGEAQPRQLAAERGEYEALAWSLGVRKDKPKMLAKLEQQLAAELEKADNLFKVSRKHCVENQELKKQLAAERDAKIKDGLSSDAVIAQLTDQLKEAEKKLEGELENGTTLFRQLVQALAAIEQHNARIKNNPIEHKPITIDDTALREHVKPLVEALEAIRDNERYDGSHLASIARDALAKVKP